MIKSITSNSKHVIATGGFQAPYVSSNSSNPIQGMVRINGSEFQVFDGTTWMNIASGSGSVGLTGAADSAIDWAIKRMEQEKAWEDLAKKNQAVKIALDNLENARRQLEITANLAREHDTETTS